MNQNSPITPSDILVLATIASLAFGVVTTITKIIIDLATKKFGPKVLPEQPYACKYDHERIHTVIMMQNKNMERMLAQNGEQITAIRDASHAAQLRHEIVLAKLSETSRRLDDIHKGLGSSSRS
jgi:hypothetical protein